MCRNANISVFRRGLVLSIISIIVVLTDDSRSEGMEPDSDHNHGQLFQDTDTLQTTNKSRNSYDKQRISTRMPSEDDPDMFDEDSIQDRKSDGRDGAINDYSTNDIDASRLFSGTLGGDMLMNNSDAYCDGQEQTEAFNITDAVHKGVQAQYEICDGICDGNSRHPVGLGDSCSPFRAWCQPCKCDQACVLYGDCCPTLDDSSTVQTGNTEHLCLEVQLLGKFLSSVWVIASCPASSSDSLGIFRDCVDCGDNPSLRQLVVSEETHAIFCNPQCALCNDESNFTIVNVQCSEPAYSSSYDSETAYSYSYDSDGSSDDTQDSSENSGINVNDTHTTSYPSHQSDTQRPSSVSYSTERTVCGPSIPEEHWPFVRQYCSQAQKDIRNKTLFISNCNQTITSQHADGDRMKDLCHQYLYPVRIQDQIYRNLFCALCSGVLPGSLVHDQFILESRSSLELNILTFLGSYPPQSRTESQPEQCLNKEEWYDVAVNACRLVHCYHDRHWSPGQPYCTDPVRNATNITTTTMYLYHVNLVMKPSVQFDCAHNWTYTEESTLVSHFAAAVRAWNSTFYTVHNWCSDVDLVSSAIYTTVEFIIAPKENQTDFELQMMRYFTGLKLHSKILSDGSSLTYDVSLLNQDNRILANVIAVPFTNVIAVSFTNGWCCRWVWGQYFTLFSYFQTHRSDRHTQLEITEIFFDALTPYALVTLNGSEYERIADDVYELKYINASLEAWRVRETHRGLVVPFIFLQEIYRSAGLIQSHSQQDRDIYGLYGLDSEVLQILTLCCLIVSIVSLVFLLTTYCFFSELRTLPGINTMFLAWWLLVGQVLLLTVVHRTDNVTICRVLGVILHYSWLCVVSWSSVCSFHMFYVFVIHLKKMHVPHSQRWYIKRYVVVGHGIPIFTVALVLSCMAVWSDGQDIGYGGRICYLNSVLLVGVAFVLPLSLSVLLNLVLLTVTARAVSKVKRVQSSGRQSERNNVRIYSGLSSLTGLCWVVALLAEVPGCGWLYYLSTVLNGLQGLHLAVSYAGNRRVRNLWRNLLIRWARSKTERSTSASTSTSNDRRTAISSI